MLRKIIISALFLVFGFCLNVLSVQPAWAHEIPNGEPVPPVQARSFSAAESLCVDGVNSAFDNYSQHSIQIVVFNFVGNEAVSAADAVTRAWQIAAEANAFFDNGMDIHGYGGKLIFSTMPGDCNTPKIYSLDVPAGSVNFPMKDFDPKILQLLEENDLWKPNRQYMAFLNLKLGNSDYCGLARVKRNGIKQWNQNSINTVTDEFYIAPWQGSNCNEGRVVVHEFGHNAMDAIKNSRFLIAPGKYSKSSTNPFAHYESNGRYYDAHAAELVDMMRPGGWIVGQYAFMREYATPYKEYFGWEFYYPYLLDPARGTYCNPNRATGSFLYKYYNACDVEGNGSPYFRIWQEKMPDGQPVVVCNETLGSPESRFYALKLCLHRATGIWWLEAALKNDTSQEETDSRLTTGQRCMMPLYETEMDGGFKFYKTDVLNSTFAGGICFGKIPLSGAPSVLRGEFTTFSTDAICMGTSNCKLSTELDISALMQATTPVIRPGDLSLVVAATAEVVEGSPIPITMTLNSPYHFPVVVNLNIDGKAKGNYTFPYGTVQVVSTMKYPDDNLAQPDRTVPYTVSVLSGMPAQAQQGTILIHDNDARQLSISTPITRVFEGTALPVFVRLSQAANNEVSGSIGIAGGAIYSEQPFVLTPGQQTLTMTQTITDNGVDDPDSVLAIALQNVVANPQDMVITTTISLTVSVIDALDTRPMLSWAVPYSITEGATGSITVTLSGPVLHPVIAKVKTSGPLSAPATVSIAAGETVAYVLVSASQTAGWQGEQIAGIELFEVQNAEIVQGKQTLIVADSEPRPDMIFLPVIRR